jgi:hypothetical protein
MKRPPTGQWPNFYLLGVTVLVTPFCHTDMWTNTSKYVIKQTREPCHGCEWHVHGMIAERNEWPEPKVWNKCLYAFNKCSQNAIIAIRCCYATFCHLVGLCYRSFVNPLTHSDSCMHLSNLIAQATSEKWQDKVLKYETIHVVERTCTYGYISVIGVRHLFWHLQWLCVHVFNGKSSTARSTTGS